MPQLVLEERMRILTVAGLALGLALTPAMAQKKPAAKDAAPGQQQTTPGTAKDFAPGQNQTKPGGAKNLAPGQKNQKPKG
jgi:hypothetical protein